MLSGWHENGKRVAGPYRSGYGLSIEDPFHPWVWKAEGGVEGFSAWFKVLPGAGKGFAVLMNHSNLPDKTKAAIEDALNWDSNAGLDFSESCAQTEAIEFESGYFRRDNPRNALFQAYENIFGGIYLRASELGGGLFEIETAKGDFQFVQICGRNQDALNPSLALGWLGKSEAGELTFEVDGKHFTAENPIWSEAARLVLSLIRAFELVTIAIAIFLVFQIRSRRKEIKSIFLNVVMNLLPYWFTFGGIDMVETVDFNNLGHFGISSFTLLMLSCASPMISILGFWNWVQLRKKLVKPMVKIFILVQVCINFLCCIFLAANGLLPFASWVY
jgi:hypothetical protein